MQVNLKKSKTGSGTEMLQFLNIYGSTVNKKISTVNHRTSVLASQ